MVHHILVNLWLVRSAYLRSIYIRVFIVIINSSEHNMTTNPVALVRVTRDDSAGWYRVSVDNGYEGRYPYVWLRDNCRCPQCYQPSSSQRSSRLADLDPEVIPSTEKLVDDGRVLKVIWPDQHVSYFEAGWLNLQRFSESEKDVVCSPELQPWGRELLNENIPTFEFDKLLHDDEELYKWLNALSTLGLAIVSNAPTEMGVIRKLAEHVAFLKRTVFGEEYQVLSKHDASNLAYTTNSLGFHNDLPYYNYTPGIQLLHCIEQADLSGGENQFVDGLNVSEQIREEFPDVYQLLRTQELDFSHAGSEDRPYDLKYRRPMIQYNKSGEFEGVAYNDIARASYMNLPVERITEMYKALAVFNKVMYRPENVVQHRLEAGEIATFNCRRLFHDRRAYTVSEAGRRHLEGGYMDWDEVQSRMRILRKNLHGIETSV